MKNESNITTKVILAATLSASCASVTEYDYFNNYGMIPSRTHAYDYVDNTFSQISRLKENEGTSTIFWADRQKRSNNILNKPPFELNINSSSVIEIADELFRHSLLLDKEMSQALINTINRIGKNSTELPNRL